MEERPNWKKRGEWPDEPGYWWSWLPGNKVVYMQVWSQTAIEYRANVKTSRYFAKVEIPDPPLYLEDAR